jgi:hypothetical protein
MLQEQRLVVHGVAERLTGATGSESGGIVSSSKSTVERASRNRDFRFVFAILAFHCCEAAGAAPAAASTLVKE